MDCNNCKNHELIYDMDDVEALGSSGCACKLAKEQHGKCCMLDEDIECDYHA
jgi:hypothetical protein